MRDVVMISLVPTTRENWKDALNLQVQAHKNHFVPAVAARKLYEKLGFCETGVVYEDEIVYRFTF